jgi:L-asparaginase
MKILLITTGGTIAAVPTPEGLAPDARGGALPQALSMLGGRYQIEHIPLFNMDSANMQPEEWREIARCVYERAPGHAGVVITHGTDTMAYTASALSYMLRGLTLPVVLTGAQLPASHPLSDAVENLRTAFAMAATGVPGVFIAFDRLVMLGARTVKVRTTGFRAFESVNLPPVGVVDGEGLTLRRELIPRCSGPFTLKDELCNDVFLLKLTPGFQPEFLTALGSMHTRGVVIEAFGAGGLHFIRRNLVEPLEELVKGGMAVAVSSQCLYERSDFSLYQTGRKALDAGVIQCYDMTTEAAVTKLKWALGQTEDLDEVRRMFATCYAGEITLP